MNGGIKSAKSVGIAIFGNSTSRHESDRQPLLSHGSESHHSDVNVAVCDANQSFDIGSNQSGTLELSDINSHMANPKQVKSSNRYVNGDYTLVHPTSDRYRVHETYPSSSVSSENMMNCRQTADYSELCSGDAHKRLSKPVELEQREHRRSHDHEPVLFPRSIMRDKDSQSDSEHSDMSHDPLDGVFAESENEISRHCHSDKPAPPDKLARKQLITVTALCVTFMIGEAVGGAISHSLALFTDVIHLGSDLISFLISLLAVYLAAKSPTKHMSFGYHRTEVLGALFSVFVIWLVTGVLLYMAIESIQHQHYTKVQPNEMVITAICGVVFNIIMGFVLHSEICCKGSGSKSHFGHSHGGGGRHGHSHGNSSHDHHSHSKSLEYSDTHSWQDTSNNHDGADTSLSTFPPPDDQPRKHKNINVRAAFIHVIGDIIQSIGVLIAAIIIKFSSNPQYRVADPICTFLFSILVLFTTIAVLRDAVLVILEGAPRDIDYNSLKIDLETIPGVKTAHSLHVWSLTIDRNAVLVHIAIGANVDFQRVLFDASQMLKQKYDFYHTTVQVEKYDHRIMSTCADCRGPLK